MRIPLRFGILLFGLASVASVASVASAQERRVAITVDDLPAVSTQDSAEVEFVTRRLLDAFEAHGVTAVGFVNAGKMSERPEFRSDLLRRWLAAGHELGNHGAYHLSANDAPLAAFLQDVELGDSVPRVLSAELNRSYRWFRLPYLHSGRNDTTRAAMDSVFARLQLQDAPVTLDSRDWLFAAAWRTALVRGDTSETSRIGTAFLDYTDDIIAYHERLAKKVVGRSVAHVLLVHANPMTAALMDALLTRLHARQYAIVPLEVAMQDAVYARPDRYRGTIGLAWLERQAMFMRGVRIDDVPLPPAWVEALAAAPMPQSPSATVPSASISPGSQ